LPRMTMGTQAGAKRPSRPQARGPRLALLAVLAVLAAGLYACPPAGAAGAAENYRLEIGGAVRNSLSLTLKQLRQFPRCEFQTGETGTGSQMDCYGGVLLRDLLAVAGPLPEARVVVFFCADGMGARLPLDYVMEGRLLIAHERDGRALDLLAGGPVKAVPDGLVGYKWVDLGGLKRVLLLKTSELTP
jgi:DMSO/TMAO reductase YedYZ molybdopterin-dependent catalytic subunit